MLFCLSSVGLWGSVETPKSRVPTSGYAHLYLKVFRTINHNSVRLSSRRFFLAVVMSFATPRNVPNFNNPQRSVENGHWGGAGLSRIQNGHSGPRIGGKLENYFDKRQLPMYKDKPYNYAASGRPRPWYQRRRILAGLLCGIFGLAYWLGLFSGARVDHVESDNSWAWLRKPSSSNVDWNDRRERVKEAFTLSWDGYEKYAWGRLILSRVDFQQCLEGSH